MIPERLTPAELRDVIARARITQARAAELCGCALRTMQQWIAGDRAMPVSASMLLMAQLVLRGMPAGLARPWLGDDLYAALARQPCVTRQIALKTQVSAYFGHMSEP